MDCLPLDAECEWAQFQHEVIAEAAEKYFLEKRRFSLGTFNGREFIYTWFGKTPVIIIYAINEPPSETPDVLMGE